MSKVYVYTRPVSEENYPAGLARSVHFAAGDDKTPLNRNYGILFASGIITEKNTICPMGVKDPGIFVSDDGDICICAERVLENGDADELSAGKFVLWKTKDLIRFSDEELVSKEELLNMSRALRSEKASKVLQSAFGGTGSVGDAAEGHTVPDCTELEDRIVNPAIKYWSQVSCIGITLPTDITVTSAEDIDNVQAFISYNDDSYREKSVSWDISNVLFDSDGEYEITGHISQQRFRFPLAEGYGDPVIFKWEGKWYYISTNDNLNDIGFYVREAGDVQGLFADDVEAVPILDFDPSRNLEQTFWAPEFHVIGDDLWILFAVSGHSWGPQCHMMKFKKGGRINDPGSWDDPVRVVRKDGTPLAENGITLDMTYIKAASGSYVIWSYREHIMDPLDTGSMLYIASIDDAQPWMLTSDPVLLTRPLLGWENVSGTINNEGPYGFVKDGKVYVTYSGGAANGYTYALGLLTADEEADLTDPLSWSKSITPVLTFYSVEGEYGPGHNSFFTNDDGELMIAYHGETSITEHLRVDGIRRVHFRDDGSPYFQMAASDDVPDMDVKMKIKVRI
ncbi:MAG: family 43 glycosylhydrolase [Lachnospiraceae bacterium]|nr:family 43 glycosylhydrolase [Lachnospiraceae bacterium]